MTTPKTPATPQALPPTTATKPKLRRRARTPKRPKALTLGGMIPRRKPKSLFTGAAGPPRAPSGPATSPSPASPPPAGSVPIPGPLIAQMTQMSPHMDFAPLRPVFARWRDDPVLFVQQALHVKRIEPWQMAALRDLVRSNRVAVRSGHGVGKSAMQSWVVLWYLFTRSPVKIACTAPTSHQLYDVLWSEVSKWARQLHPFLLAMIKINTDRIELLDNPEECFAVARTARKEQPEAFQGFHSENMLFLIDEASGVDDLIFEVGEGALSTKGAKALMCGNPTRTSGYFYEAFHRMREVWKTHKVSCFDSSRCSADYTDAQALKYGVDSNVYRVRVLGEFPKQDDDTVISLAQVEDASVRAIEPEGKIVWGLDVARFGNDRTALCRRRGNVVTHKVLTWRNKDTMQVAGIIGRMFEELDSFEQPSTIVVDVIGIGSGVVDRMAELGLPVIGINVSESPAIGEKFSRLRDELWWRAREWFEQMNCALPDDETLMGELATVRYGIKSDGKIKVESKDEMKKRGLPSPDVADAFVLTFAEVGRGRQKVRRTRQASWRVT